MLKNLLHLLVNLLVNPKEGWGSLSTSNMTQGDFLKRYFYPLLAIAAASVFLGMIRTTDALDLQHCIMVSTVVIVQNFMGYYLAIFLYKEMLTILFKQEPKTGNSSQLFIGANLLVLMALNLAVSLLPSLSILGLLPLYVVVVIWKGAQYYITIEEDKGIMFTTFASLILLGSPWIIGVIMHSFLPGI